MKMKKVPTCGRGNIKKKTKTKLYLNQTSQGANFYYRIHVHGKIGTGTVTSKYRGK